MIRRSGSTTLSRRNSSAPPCSQFACAAKRRQPSRLCCAGLPPPLTPELRLNNVLNLEEALRRDQWIRQLEAAVLLSTSLSVLLLAGAGIYAMMSLTITQRRKEIGIRMALGADGRQVVTGVFARVDTTRGGRFVGVGGGCCDGIGIQRRTAAR